MDLHRGTLGFLLLLPLHLCFKDLKVFLKKHISSDADMTRLCTTDTQTSITTVLCKIQRGGSGDSCYLRFIPGQRNESNCGSRITLKAQNQTVFLHLLDLTPEDSGMYNCVCYRDVIMTIQLNVTVEDFQFVPVNERGKANDNKETDINIIILCSSVTACVLTCGVIVSCIYKRICCRRQSQPAVTEGEEMDTYAALQRPNNDLYQTISDRNSVLDPRHRQGKRI